MNQADSISPSTDDEACFAAYHGEFDYLIRTLQRLGVPPRDVEDLAHEVFLVLRATWAEYDAKRALKPYLFGIAFRVVSSHRRRHWREVALPGADGPDLAPDPTQSFESKEARALVLAGLQRIPELRRVVLIMHDLDEVPVQEVAATLGLPLFTVYSRLRKARRELEVAVSDLRTRSLLR